MSPSVNTAAEHRRIARIAELDAAIAAAEDACETHSDLDGARDWYQPTRFDKLAYEAGYDFTERRSEQSSSVIAWLEGYEAEARRDRSAVSRQRIAA